MRAVTAVRAVLRRGRARVGIERRIDGRPVLRFAPRCVGDVAVLPANGRQAWLRRAAANEQRFRGHHGGLHEAETGTYLARMTD